MGKITRPLLPDGVGKTYVEIGGIKWATMNIGASNETDYGLYFQWGDTAGYTASQVGSNTTNYKKPFNWADCVLHKGSSSTVTLMTKYNANDGLTELEPVNDAAVANWGGKWRMPTFTECQELARLTTQTWTDDYKGSGVSGNIRTSKTDSTKTLFFPSTGRATNGGITDEGSTNTQFWSSSLYVNSVSYGRTMSGYSLRCSGHPIRPVYDESL